MPEKYKDLQALIRAHAGPNADYDGSETMPNGDIMWHSKGYYCGSQDLDEGLAHYCPTCKIFYYGAAKTNDKAERFCAECKTLDPREQKEPQKSEDKS